MESGIQVVNLS